ncbi:MAG: hypothetical protein LBR16_00255 [Treponema sp.]|nr:hypothetical protein [Treponema sp.]
MDANIEQAFAQRVTKAIQEMKALGYTPKILMGMIADTNAVTAIKTLLHKLQLPAGFTTLWEMKRLDLAMENIILEDAWKDLFTEQERQIARKRLSDYGFFPKDKPYVVQDKPDQKLASVGFGATLPTKDTNNSITFDAVYELLLKKGPGHTVSSRGKRYRIEAKNGNIVGFPSSGYVIIHEDCWGRHDRTCKGTWAGGIYNGPYSIYDWYRDNR